MKALKVRAIFLGALLGSAAVAGSGYYFAWVHALAELSRSHMFILSWGLMLVVGALGLILEDRLIWKGRLVAPDLEGKDFYGRNGPFPPIPISFGVIVGLMSFMGWS